MNRNDQEERAFGSGIGFGIVMTVVIFFSIWGMIDFLQWVLPPVTLELKPHE